MSSRINLPPRLRTDGRILPGETRRAFGYFYPLGAQGGARWYGPLIRRSDGRLYPDYSVSSSPDFDPNLIYPPLPKEVLLHISHSHKGEE